MSSIQKTRNYCFTINNYPEGWKNKITKLKNLRYIIAGQEKAPTTGTPHLQGYLQFEKGTSLIQCIKRFKKIGFTPHVEIAKGNLESNIKYCKKEDSDAFTWGEAKTAGQRTDLRLLHAKIKSGEYKTKKDVIENEFELYCRYRGGINDALQEYNVDRAQDFRHVDVEYVYGPTGTGKTRYIHEQKDCFTLNGSDLKWFDGYRGESCLGIDEYDNNISCSDMLSLLDGYTKRLPIKGGFTYAHWTKIIITSNIHPSDLHKAAKDIHRRAFWRRVDRIIWCPDLDKKIIHGKEEFETLCYTNLEPIGFTFD